MAGRGAGGVVPSARCNREGFAPVVEVVCKPVPEEPSGASFAAGSA